MWKTKLVYEILKIQNGLLLDVVDSWGNLIFLDNQYPSQELAIQAVQDSEYVSENLIIVEKAFRYFETE